MITEAISVLCVDDHRLMREGIVRLIEFDPEIKVVAEAASGEEAVERFLLHRPNVTLMDIQLRGMNGLHAIRAIRQIDSDARIVVLTMYERDDSIYQALQAGAMAYLPKDSVPEELIRVIRQVHAGGRPIPPDVETRLRQPVLTIREIEVLELLVKGMSNKEIGFALVITEATARAHIKSIFLKLNVHDRTAALSEALRRGIVHL
jgi:two-component system, NarL family, response regulator